MLGLDTLDVAIGLVFVYLTLSFVCSAAAEMIEAMVKNRPKKLLEGMQELLKSDDLVKKLYDHPLVSALYEGAFSASSGSLPSYVPSRNFALAVLDLLPDAQGNDAFTKLNNRVQAWVADTNKRLAAAGGKATKEIEGEQYVQKALTAILEHSDQDEKKAIAAIEDWYNSAMDRVSGWFKRRTHVLLLILGAMFAVAMNVDTIYIVKHLSVDKTAREAFVAEASAAAKTAPTSSTDFEKSLTTLEKAGLPIGWDLYDPTKQCLIWSILGWLLTAFAVSLGAPFWFDILNKIIVVRSTVKPEEKSGTEAPKEPQKTQ
jgi:hypothetical protein